MLICPKCGKASRLGYKITAVGAEGQKKKVKSRICKKCKQVID